MNAVTFPRAVPATQFTCWRLTTGAAQPHPVTSTALIEIEREIAAEAHHGETFLVREDDPIREQLILHVYRVRKGKWAGRFDGARKTYPYVADRLFSVPVKAFEPVEPWKWAPGCDVLGRGKFVEGTAA